MSSIDLVCLDFDGTIMVYDEPPGFFHPAAIAAINGLGKRGVSWCTNSGRDRENQLEILRASEKRGLECLPEALLSAECFIHERNGRDYSPLEPWDSETRQRLRAFHASVHKAVEPHLGAWRKKFSPEVTVFEDGATVFLIPGEAEIVALFREELRVVVRQVPHAMVTQNGGWVGALPDQLGKGNVLSAYLDACGTPPDRTLVVGDHLNDLNMLDGRAADHVGCPADAVPEVIEAVRGAGGYVAVAEGPLGTVEVMDHYGLT